MSDEANKYRVLIVDDEESMRDFLSIMLHREGYQVDTAVDGAQAVVHLRDHSYDWSFRISRCAHESEAGTFLLSREISVEPVLRSV